MFNATRDAMIHELIQAGRVITDPETGLVRIDGIPDRAHSSGYMTAGPQQLLSHRVMWLAHHPHTPSTLQINHRNGRRWDNRLSNLEAVTPSGNQLHANRADYAAVSAVEDGNSVDPAWFESVMALAERGDVTVTDIQALKTQVPVDDSAASPFAVRRLSRLIHTN